MSYRISKLDIDMPFIGIRLELTLLFLWLIFAWNCLPWELTGSIFICTVPVHDHVTLLVDPMCVHFTVSHVCTWFPTWSPPPVSQRAVRFPETPSPARLGPAVDSVQQSSTYRPTCQDASSALTGQTREKAWTGWRQIFPKWLSRIGGRYLISPYRN